MHKSDLKKGDTVLVNKYGVTKVITIEDIITHPVSKETGVVCQNCFYPASDLTEIKKNKIE